MKKIFIFIIVLHMLFSMNFVFAATGQENVGNSVVYRGNIKKDEFLTLQDCVATALENNPAIKIATNNKSIYQLKIKEVWANYFPTIALSAGISSETKLKSETNTRSWSCAKVGIQQRLFDFGKTSDSAKKAKDDLEIAENDFDDLVSRLVRDVKVGYYNLLYTLMVRDVYDEKIAEYKKHLEEAKALQRRGRASEVMIKTIEINLANASTDRDIAHKAVKLAYEGLYNSMGVRSMPWFNPSDKLKCESVSFEYDDYMQATLERFAAIQSVEYKIDKAELDLKLTKKELLPELYGISEFESGGTNLTDATRAKIGGNLTFPTLNAYGLNKRISQRKIDIDTQKVSLEKARQDTFLDSKTKYLDYVGAVILTDKYTKTLEQAKMTYDVGSQQFVNGNLSSVDLKDIVELYAWGKINLYTFMFKYNKSIAEMEYYYGKTFTKSAVNNI